MRLEARETGEAMRFAHPLSLHEADWETILRGIRMQPRKRFLPSIGAGQPGPREAFTESERRYLARHLSQAFSQAKPDDWVVFALSQPREEDGDVRGGPGVTEVTSGGFFVEGGQLHLRLANYRFAITMRDVVEKIRNDPLRPGGDAFYELVAGRHQTIGADEEPGFTVPFRTQVPELVIEYQAWLTRPDQKPGDPDASEPKKPQPIDERLRTLRGLWDDGLITEEEYRQKRQKLLDEL